MHLKLDPQAALPIYAQLMAQLKDLIIGGTLVDGAALPSVRQLADQLEINSLTIQKAYKGLASDGFINIKKGVGAFVSHNPDATDQVDKRQIIIKELGAVIKRAKALSIEKKDLLALVELGWEM